MFNKIKNRKGFTLMEMLIVVAIIAILVAIAIPTFNNSLNKARVATDAANLRAAYAELMVKYLGDPDATIADISVKTTGTTDAAGITIAGTGNTYTWTKDKTITVSINTSTGEVTFTGDGFAKK